MEGESRIPGKLSPPKFPEPILHREHILDSLGIPPPTPVIFLCAGPGYGKSILLYQLAHSFGPFVWYTFERQDRDPRCFLRWLTLALEPFLPDTSLITEEPGFLSLLNALSGLTGPLLLVLDDCQVIFDSPTFDLIHRLLQHRPPRLFLALASRCLPDWDDLPQLQSRGDVRLLQAEELRFIPDEARNLAVDSYGMDISPAQLQALMARTEGWPIAVQLALRAALSLGNLEEALRHLEEPGGPLPAYLASEVLEAQPAQLREFLRDTSILGRLTPSLCNALLQITDAEEKLNRIYRENLFLYREGNGHPPSYHYHPLFAAFLQSLLRRDKARWQMLHSRAAQILEGQDDPAGLEQAIEHRLCAGEPSKAIPLIIRLAPSMLQSSRLNDLEGWIARIPEEGKERHPALLLFLAQVQIERGLMDAALATLHRAEENFRRQGDEAGLSRALRHRGTVLWREGEIQEAIASFSQALEHLPPEARRDRAALLNTLALAQAAVDLPAAKEALREARRIMAEEGDRFGLATVLTNLAGFVLFRQGKLDEALRALEKAAGIFQELDNRHFLAYCFGNTATILALKGEYERAGELARRTLNIGRELGLRNIEGRALDTLAFLELVSSPPNPDQALKYARECFRCALECENRGAEVDARLMLAFVHRRRGETVEAEREATQALTLSREMNNRWDIARSLRELAVVNLAAGNLQEAREHLKESRRLLEAYQARFALTEVDFWLAATALAEENDEEAIACFKRALGVARQHGYDAIFLRERHHSLPLLALALAQGLELDYTVHLLRHIGTEATPYLLERLPSSDRNAQERIISLLGEIGDRRALAPLETLGGKGGKLASLAQGAAARIASRPPVPLRVYLLGPFAVLRGGEVITIWGSRKAEQMFKYLVAHRGEWLPREVLIELLWPESQPKAGEKSFYLALRQVRQALDPHLTRSTLEAYIASREGAYGFNPQVEMWVDAEEFECLCRRGRILEREKRPGAAAEAYRQAVSLYRGDFLAEDLYLEWAIPRRERLRNLYLEALEWLALHHFRRGEYRESIHYAELILEKDGCREDAHRLLMRCYARLGQRNRALRQYHLCRETVQRELDIEPMPETTILYERIRSGEEV